MSALTTIVALEAAGVRLFVAGKHLRFVAPDGALTPALRAAAATCRAEIIEAIEAMAAPAGTRTSPDWLEAYCERLAIMVVDGHVPAAEAPVRARRSVCDGLVRRGCTVTERGS